MKEMPVQSDKIETRLLDGQVEGSEEGVKDLHNTSGLSLPFGDAIDKAWKECDNTTLHKQNGQTASDLYDSMEKSVDNDQNAVSRKSTNKVIGDLNDELTNNRKGYEMTLVGDICKESKHSEDIVVPLLRTNEANVDDCYLNGFKTDNKFKVPINDRRVADNNDTRDVPGKLLNRTKSCLEDPPDGGWGWVVTFSAFMVGVILDGISFSFGLFFKELYVYFNESKSLTSWIISVLNGTYLGIGK